MGEKFAILANLDVFADDAKRADGAAFWNVRSGIDDCCGVNASAHAGRLTNWHVTVASQASLPSTQTLPCIFTAVVRHARTSTSTRSWSPGLMGLRNLAR